MKTTFTREVDGITYQGELPLDVMLQMEMAQLFYFEQKADDKLLERLEIANKLDKMLIPYCNIVDSKGELLTKGNAKKGLEAKQLISLCVIYRQELIAPLV